MDDVSNSPANALRAVDWRAQLARILVARDRYPSPTQVDYVTGELVAYLTARRRLSQRALGKRFWDLAEAVVLYESASPLLRFGLEAMLLTPASTSAIAARLGLSQAVVNWYAASYFDVRDRLGAKLFIDVEVLEACRRRHDADPREYYWKVVAYKGGEAPLLTAIGLSAKIESSAELVAALEQQTRLALAEQFRRQALEGSVDNLEMLARLASRSPSSQSTEYLPNYYERNVQEALDFMKFRAGPSDPDSPLREFEESAVELNGREQFALANGVRPPNADQLKNLSFAAVKKPPV